MVYNAREFLHDLGRQQLCDARRESTTVVVNSIHHFIETLRLLVRGGLLDFRDRSLISRDGILRGGLERALHPE